MTVPAAVKALSLTPPTPSKKQHQFHSIAAILSSNSLVKEEMMGKMDQDMEGNSNLNVDGNTSEEDGDEEYADYVEKKMRLAAKTEVQPWSQKLKLLDFLPKSIFCKIISML